ncbi:Uncharacterized protein HZ326_6263 [Fusarium oxysporum f. sp. albedinis]|nr:Uncharacterized protein HZ326_6263 [Fusarium oxysporum f. sp. albedinis]
MSGRKTVEDASRTDIISSFVSSEVPPTVPHVVQSSCVCILLKAAKPLQLRRDVLMREGLSSLGKPLTRDAVAWHID